MRLSPLLRTFFRICMNLSRYSSQRMTALLLAYYGLLSGSVFTTKPLFLVGLVYVSDLSLLRDGLVASGCEFLVSILIVRSCRSSLFLCSPLRVFPSNLDSFLLFRCLALASSLLRVLSQLSMSSISSLSLSSSEESLQESGTFLRLVGEAFLMVGASLGEMKLVCPSQRVCLSYKAGSLILFIGFLLLSPSSWSQDCARLAGGCSCTCLRCGVVLAISASCCLRRYCSLRMIWLSSI